MNKSKLSKLVQNIAYPKIDTEKYFEWHSADGFAFLGAAKAILGLDFQQELVEMRTRNYCLNYENYVGGKLINANSQYIYTLWACSEFLRAAIDAEKYHKRIHLENELKRLFEKVRQIGIYPTFRMHRYCDQECNLIVPNATSAASLIAIFNNNIEYSALLLFGLYDNQQPNHNWDYIKITDEMETIQKIKQEDCYHLAMIIYHLQEISSILGRLIKQHQGSEKIRRLNLICNIMINKAMKWFSNSKDCCAIGWESKDCFCNTSFGFRIPMMTLAISKYGKSDLHVQRLQKIGIKKTIIYLNHDNFRVRSLSAWVLARIIKK